MSQNCSDINCSHPPILHNTAGTLWNFLVCRYRCRFSLIPTWAQTVTELRVDNHVLLRGRVLACLQTWGSQTVRRRALLPIKDRERSTYRLL
jgi:hypothetical protein